MSVIQWFITGAVIAGLLWFWRWCVRWSLHDGGSTNVWGSMFLGLIMIPTAVIWLPIALGIKLCTNRNIARRLEKVFPPL